MSYTAEPELGFIRVDNAEPILLRPYQTESIDQLRANIRAKIKNQILSAPTGAGKTQMGAMLLHECWQKEKRGMFIVDRISLLGQASACFDRYGIPHGIIQARHPRYRPQELIQVASIQTLARQGWPDADLMICDECFVAGTLIDTPMGKIPIEKLRAGDLVFNACGVSQISLVSRREIRRLVEIQTNHGKIIRCTPEHPIFTESGWTDATKLERGAVLFGEEDLQDLWEGIWSVDRRRDRGGGVSVAECEVLQSVLLQEAEESNAQPVGPTEGFPNTIQNWSSSKESRGERNRNDDISRDGIASIGRRMGIGRNCENIWTRRGVSKSLQDRCREFSPDDRYRNRWKQPPLLQAEGSRQKEGHSTSRIRVEGVAYIKCTSGVPVFNLRVSNHPSYFAGGILVHNCHILYKSMAARLAKDKGIIIGLTATPFTKGLGRHYKAIVSVRTTNQLIGEGFLVPFKCWAAAEPDMTKAKRGDVDRFGEWTDEFAREQSMPIIGDVVAEYEKHGNGKKFICFGVDVAHCEALQKQFIGAGINTSLYTYLTCDEEREMLIGERGEFRKPDSSVRGLISVAALSRGFDVPDVHCILMCRPLRRSFAEFIQVLGRGLRPYPGKEFAVLLDLAGNMMRHHGAMEEFFEFGAQELDDGKPKPKETKALEEKKEKKPIKCPQCAFVFKAGRQCPQCGYIFPSRNSVEHEQGELKEFKSGQKMARADKMTLHAELSHIALKKGYKLGWIAHAYRWFTGVWPQGVSNGTIPPSPQTLAALRRRNKEQGKPEKRQTELDLFL